jgi:hypothetical protein
VKFHRWFFVVLLALLATVARGAPPESRKDIELGIAENLHANYRACNEENMKKLLACMSQEMPNRELFVQTVHEEWENGDTYNRLDAVEVLEHSDAPHANCQYPYATAWITQTVIQVQSENAQQASVFRKKCKNGRCDISALAHKMGVTTRTETTKLQMLFKHERGQWKLIAGLTDPVPVDETALLPEEPEAQEEEAVELGAPGPRPKMTSVFN